MKSIRRFDKILKYGKEISSFAGQNYMGSKVKATGKWLGLALPNATSGDYASGALAGDGLEISDGQGGMGIIAWADGDIVLGAGERLKIELIHSDGEQEAESETKKRLNSKRDVLSTIFTISRIKGQGE